MISLHSFPRQNHFNFTKKQEDAVAEKCKNMKTLRVNWLFIIVMIKHLSHLHLVRKLVEKPQHQKRSYYCAKKPSDIWNKVVNRVKASIYFEWNWWFPKIQANVHILRYSIIIKLCFLWNQSSFYVRKLLEKRNYALVGLNLKCVDEYICVNTNHWTESKIIHIIQKKRYIGLVVGIYYLIYEIEIEIECLVYR